MKTIIRKNRMLILKPICPMSKDDLERNRQNIISQLDNSNIVVVPNCFDIIVCKKIKFKRR